MQTDCGRDGKNYLSVSIIILAFSNGNEKIALTDINLALDHKCQNSILKPRKVSLRVICPPSKLLFTSRYGAYDGRAYVAGHAIKTLPVSLCLYACLS